MVMACWNENMLVDSLDVLRFREPTDPVLGVRLQIVAESGLTALFAPDIIIKASLLGLYF